MDDPRENMGPLIQAIVDHIPQPKVEEGSGFKMLVSTLDYEPHLGRIIMGKITSGSVRPGDKLKTLTPEGELVEEGTALRLIVRRGIQTLIMESGAAGDIVGVAGFPKSTVSHTLCSPEGELLAFVNIRDKPLTYTCLIYRYCAITF